MVIFDKNATKTINFKEDMTDYWQEALHIALFML